MWYFFFFQAEDGIRDAQESRGLGDVYKRQVHHSTPARARRPCEAMRVNALRSRMRQIKPKDGGDPWRDGTSTLPCRLGCSCGGGSRASWHGDDCSVGRCASRSPPRATLWWRFSKDDKLPWRAAATSDAKGQSPRLEARAPEWQPSGQEAHREPAARRRAMPTEQRRLAVGRAPASVPPLICDLSTRCGQACGQYLTD